MGIDWRYRGCFFWLLTLAAIVAALCIIPVCADVSNIPRYVDLSDYLPPIADQGNRPTCTAWACSYYYRSFQARMAGQDVTFSPGFTYADAGHCNGTLGIWDALQSLSQGALPLEMWPAWACREPTLMEHEAASRYGLSATHLLFQGQGNADVDALRKHLAWGDGFVTCIPIYENWYRFGFRWISVVDAPRNGKPLLGWHTVCCVGYDDSRQAFLAANSQGQDWGWGGFVWLSYDFVRQYAFEAWAMEATIAKTYLEMRH